MKHFQDDNEEYDSLEEYESGSYGHHKVKQYKEEDDLNFNSTIKHFQDDNEEYDSLEEYESGSYGHHKAKLYKEEDE